MKELIPIMILGVDWDSGPDNDDFEQMVEHLILVTRKFSTDRITIMGLQSITSKNQIWVVGPREIEHWLQENKLCPEEIFIDSLGENDPPMDWILNDNSFFWEMEEGNKLWVQPFSNNKETRIMMRSRKLRVEQILYLDWERGIKPKIY